MEWQRLPKRKRSRIISQLIHFDYEDRSSWNNTIDQMLEKMTRFIPAMEKAKLGLDALLKTTTTLKNRYKSMDEDSFAHGNIMDDDPALDYILYEDMKNNTSQKGGGCFSVIFVAFLSNSFATCQILIVVGATA